MSCTFWNLRRRKAAVVRESAMTVENYVKSVENIESAQPIVENSVKSVENSKPRKKRGGKE